MREDLKKYCSTVKPRYRDSYSEALQVITQDRAQVELLQARHKQENVTVYKYETGLYKVIFTKL